MNTEISNCHGIVKNLKAASPYAMISGLMEINIDNSVTIVKIIIHNFQKERRKGY